MTPLPLKDLIKNISIIICCNVFLTKQNKVKMYCNKKRCQRIFQYIKNTFYHLNSKYFFYSM